jgi:hypothetical protein
MIESLVNEALKDIHAFPMDESYFNIWKKKFFINYYIKKTNYIYIYKNFMFVYIIIYNYK